MVPLSPEPKPEKTPSGTASRTIGSNSRKFAASAAAGGLCWSQKRFLVGFTVGVQGCGKSFNLLWRETTGSGVLVKSFAVAVAPKLKQQSLND